LLLFIAFILQIVSRYVFNNPLVWPYELAQIAYVWVITLGCCYAQRTDDNIVFSIVYEMVGENVRKIFRLVQDVLIVGVFVYMIPANIDFYQFYFTRYSSVFKVPLGFVYFGFAIFQIITICRYIKDLGLCIRSFRQKEEK
jgi:TRAP-type C4-dicarboxylate transport system permease small subunit